jgi:hypothetical protein
MYCFIVIGMTGQGKSHFTKSYIQDRKCYVFDVNNEYELPLQGERSKNISCDEKDFIKNCYLRKETICVFEEATGFFEGKTSKELRRLIVNKRHTKNVYVFLFHSISSVPPRLLQFANFVVLFKTGDEVYQVENKYPSLFPYYMKLKEMPHQTKLTIKTIPQ